MGFKVKVEGEVVHEIEGDEAEISGVSLMTVKGEAGRVGLPVEADEVEIVFERRDLLESEWLDVVTRNAEGERRTRVEEAGSKKVEAGRKLQEEMDKKAQEDFEAAAAAAAGTPPAAPAEEELVTAPAKAEGATKKAG
jgi:hypothetical protein